ncbi:MAG: hypothetical protein QM682_02740 [Paracoccus sp. (in: a-proteobacteria)]|uniref:hypothetical protein n=1 Tax=Paracoccus sp. TaxID=267 RepID=UPI0039E3B563
MLEDLHSRLAGVTIESLGCSAFCHADFPAFAGVFVERRTTAPLFVSPDEVCAGQQWQKKSEKSSPPLDAPERRSYTTPRVPA